jgi:serine/threonine protein kinase
LDGRPADLGDTALSAPIPPASDPIEIAGRYQVIAKLGAGAFGTVFKARDKILGRMVAIKTIRLDGLAASGTSREELTDRFGREARIAAQLKHPNIVTIYDVGEAEGASYLAMEFIDGVGLDKLIASSGPLPVARTAAIAVQVAAALDYAHRHQVVHRDIKPANVMIEAGDHAKVTDFGIAKPLDAGEKLTVTGSLLGTPSYMSPEQARGGVIDGRSDLFALGCILYEMLSGKRAFVGDSITGLIFKIITEEPPPLRTLAPTVPDAMLRIVEKALSKVPEKRYQSGEEMVKGLVALTGPAVVPTIRQADVPTVALDPETVVRPEKGPDAPTHVAPPTKRVGKTPTARQAYPSPPRRSLGPVLALLGSACLILAFGALGVTWYIMRQKSTPTVTPGETTAAETLPLATPTAGSNIEHTQAAIPQDSSRNEVSTGAETDLASAQHSRTTVSVPARTEAQPTPRPVVASQVRTPEPVAPAALPSESDYALLDPLPDEGPEGAAAGQRLAGMYRRDSGANYGTSQPMRVRRRVPIGTPAERPALRMLHHIVNAEESFKSETGRYGTFTDLARSGKLAPAVIETLRRWSNKYYRYELGLEDGGFRILARPLLRREARSFVADDSGIIRPNQ